MSLITVVLLTSYLVFVSTKTIDFHHFDLSSIKDEARVVNGSDAHNGQFPYQVSLRTRQNNQHFCGGSIITSKWILSAAHCVIGEEVHSYIAVAGTNTLSNGGTTYNIDGASLHPAYDSLKKCNDIAVLKTSEEIQFNEFVQTIKLPIEDTPANVPVIISGWGLLSADETQPPNKLQYLNSTTIDNVECKKRLPNYDFDFDTFLCHFTGEYSGACAGDSGE